ncbi:Asp/Glu-specific dipeptidyl-peptidase [uncultured bacterium]|nr:Asp/Glu-specific dipeptidyl-peptidase [uncultured bacterium]
MNANSVKRAFLLFAAVLVFSAAQMNFAQSWVKVDTVKAGRFDTGKMWTFDFPPTEYFKEAYDFSPSDEWYEHVRKSALRFATYCSASFVSGDGLVMTNHHCGRESITEATKEGEDLHLDGFIATTLADERKIEGLFVDQLVVIKDITSDVQAAFDKGTTDEERVANRKAKMDEIKKNFETENPGLTGQIITFYNGGKYSLYGFKRYNDVRLVFAPEEQAGFFGGDPDNFTFPRYNLDCTFFRVYDENGKPLKTDHYFKWSAGGAEEGEPVFVVGNPGSTNRLHTVAQLEFQRDFQHPTTLFLLDGLVKVYSEVLAENPDRKLELQDQVFSLQNSQKAYGGILGGLRDPYLMAKKKDFEKNFKNSVLADADLKAKYGDLWDKIANTRSRMKEIAPEMSAYRMAPLFTPHWYFVAQGIVDYAKEMKKPEADRKDQYKGDALQATQTALFKADEDPALTKKLLSFNIAYLTQLLGENNELVKKLTGGKKGTEAVEYALGATKLNDEGKMKELLGKSADEILSCNDPFIYFIANTQDKAKELSAKAKAISNEEANYLQMLGRAAFEVYGTKMPPDATFSLRIADGVVKGYNYNGTKAPAFTTYYGMYERFYSFDGKFPWNLPTRWQNPPAEFELSTKFNFVSTNDIIGGNSGSPVINRNAEVVGLAFDGNIESLPGQFIFDETANRTVSVHSSGMHEVIQDLFKFRRLSDELKNGVMVQ